MSKRYTSCSQKRHHGVLFDSFFMMQINMLADLGSRAV
jgi:hypothetical protein